VLHGHRQFVLRARLGSESNEQNPSKRRIWYFIKNKVVDKLGY